MTPGMIKTTILGVLGLVFIIKSALLCGRAATGRNRFSCLIQRPATATAVVVATSWGWVGLQFFAVVATGPHKSKCG